MTWSGFITNNGINQARNATNNPGWYLIPYKFKVSSTKGYLNANSTIDDLTNIWYEAYFTSLEFLENNKILHKITIPIDAESISKNIGDIAFIYKDPDDNEYLFAVSKNSDTLTFEPGISREYDFAFTLNNTNVADIYNIQYTFPQDIESHNIAVDAHYDVTQTQRGFMTPQDKIKLDNLSFIDYKNYTISKGNITDGYPDLIIPNVNNTDLSFKIGGEYENIYAVFPNGKIYEISNIGEITGISSNGLITPIIIEDQLVLQPDGTYSTQVVPVSAGYSFVGNIIALTSASHPGYNASYLGVKGFNPYNVFDQNSSTYCNFVNYSSNYLFDSFTLNGTFYNNRTPFRLDCDIPITISKIIYNNPLVTYYHINGSTSSSSSTVMDIFVSSDGGTTWAPPVSKTLVTGNNIIDFSATGNAFIFAINCSRLLVDDWHSANRWVCMGTFGDIYVQQTIIAGSNNITEGFEFPENPGIGDWHRLTSSKPELTYVWNNQWNEVGMVPLGEILRLNDTFGTKVDFAYNARFDSGIISTTSGQIKTVNHNIGSTNLTATLFENGVQIAKDITLTSTTASWTSSYTGNSRIIIWRNI